jgi:hypothetical protein
MMTVTRMRTVTRPRKVPTLDKSPESLPPARAATHAPLGTSLGNACPGGVTRRACKG